MKLPAKLRHTFQFRIVQIYLLALLLNGCGGTYVYTSQISIDDSRALLPTLRTSIDLGDGKEAASHPHTGHAVEFGIASVHGSGSQFLTNGQSPVILSGTTFTGPQQLSNTFALDFVDLSYRWRKFPFESPMGFELSGGFGLPLLNITVSSPTQSASGNFNNWGLQFRPGLIFRLSQSSSVHAHMVSFVGSSSSKDTNVVLNSVSHIEISFAYALSETLSLRTGFASWSIRGRGKSGQSGFDLHASGPSFLFSWDFNARNTRNPDQSVQD